MNPAAVRVVAWGAAVTSALLVAASVALFVLVRAAAVSAPDTFYVEDAVVGRAFSVVGAIILTHKEGNAVGWLLCLAGMSGALGVFTEEYATYGLLRPGLLPGVQLIAWIGTWVWFAFFGLIPLVLLLFPDGHVPSRRWRPLARAIIVFTIGVTVVLAVANRDLPVAVLVSPDVPSGLIFGWLIPAVLFLLLDGTVASLVPLWLRWLHAGAVERQQLKWFILVAVAFVALSQLGTVWPDATALASPLALLCLPAGIGIAILRYRLYDIDRIITRTVSYTVLTAALGMIYVGGVVVLRPLLGGVAG
jgi:two-component system NarL family sensor kinase